MMPQTKTIAGQKYYRAAFTVPDLLEPADENRRASAFNLQRIPNHPIRPARSSDFNTWWEPVK